MVIVVTIAIVAFSFPESGSYLAKFFVGIHWKWFREFVLKLGVFESKMNLSRL